MQNNISNLLAICAGIILIIFRKQFVKGTLKYQKSYKKPFLVKLAERKAKSEVDWNKDVEYKAKPFLEWSYVVAGIFFILFGLLPFLGIGHFKH